ncbi:MAG TPA: two-component system response regulator KdpE, partial [Pseudomonadales bacterium]|nr:two-component system response regulator KdpE [Pseudomonadales bacterium]
LIIEDENEIRRFVKSALEHEHYRVYDCTSFKQGLTDCATRKPDLIILDLGLPDGDGVNLIREVRTWSATPIIILSARVDEKDKVEALDAGADDYLTKPFGTAELLARTRACLRRQHKSAGVVEKIQFGDITVDFANRTVHKADQDVHLTQIEFRLLASLITKPGKVLTHRQLLQDVWGPAHVEQSHYLRIYMGHLRQKLEQDPSRPRYLITETGIGYRFMPD